MRDAIARRYTLHCTAPQTHTDTLRYPARCRAVPCPAGRRTGSRYRAASSEAFSASLATCPIGSQRRPPVSGVSEGTHA
jgi:hypothetical protein